MLSDQAIAIRQAWKMCQIVFIPARVDSTAIHKSPVLVSAMVTKYQKRTSDPLLDRIDIHIECRYACWGNPPAL
jgi:hypothetical protein